MKKTFWRTVCGVDKEVLQCKLVGLNIDGTDIMMGINNGVARLYQRDFTASVDIHCVAHNLEFAMILDAMKTRPEVDQIVKLVTSIYKFYFYPPLKKREVNKVVEVLEEHPVYFSWFHQVCWLARGYRTISVLLSHLPATMAHLENTSNNNGEDSN